MPAEGAAALLELTPRSRVLHVGAPVRALSLARLGHRVLGLGHEDESVNKARAEARKEKLNAHFLKMDLRRIPYRAEFDAVMIREDFLGVWLREKDDQEGLEAAAKSLKLGGRLLIEAPNREAVLRGSRAEDFNLETGRLGGRRLYALTEIRSLLSRCGLVYRKSLGDFEGSSYALDSSRLIVLSERPSISEAVRKKQSLSEAIKIKGRRR
jgi:protein-L-isoaspartate O-methyltransferase